MSELILYTSDADAEDLRQIEELERELKQNKPNDEQAE